MDGISLEQVRWFRLHTHHLDRWYGREDTIAAAGACGLQNSPPGAWESALCNRIKGWRPENAAQLLEEDKSLLQAWSFRGAPVVFPTAESSTFLSALVPQPGEEWIYTHGIGLALEYLDMPFGELLDLLGQAIPALDGQMIQSKTALDQTLADWMKPLLPMAKRQLWCQPSMYGSPGKQTVGGAVVSFLLRPCSFMGLVVFGGRQGTSPTFTGYKSWAGKPLGAGGDAVQRLVRKYLHCFGPATASGLGAWLGCTPAQARRMWQSVAEELEPVKANGKERFILAADRDLLRAPPQPQRALHLLAGHDPYLGLQDREVILEDKANQRKVWQTVANPGAVLQNGAVAGIWKGRKKGKSLCVEITLWDGVRIPKKQLEPLAESYAAGQGLRLDGFTQ